MSGYLYNPTEATPDKYCVQATRQSEGSGNRDFNVIEDGTIRYTRGEISRPDSAWRRHASYQKLDRAAPQPAPGSAQILTRSLESSFTLPIYKAGGAIEASMHACLTSSQISLSSAESGKYLYVG